MTHPTPTEELHTACEALLDLLTPRHQSLAPLQASTERDRAREMGRGAVARLKAQPPTAFPGPWSVDADEPDLVNDKEGKPVAEVIGHPVRSRAILIAAAPAVNAAARRAVRQLPPCGCDGNDWDLCARCEMERALEPTNGLF